MALPGKKLSQLPEKTVSVVDADKVLLTDSADGLSKFATADKLPDDPSAKWVDPCIVRTTANVDLPGGGLAAGTTHDGVMLTAGMRVLVMAQTDPVENGIYPAPASGAASRAGDLPTGADASLVAVLVDQGTAHADTAWICTTNKGSAVVDTDGLTFGPFPGSSSSHASTHVSGGGDQIAGCDLACGQSPSNFTPGSATIGGMVEGIDTKLGELGAQAIAVDPDGSLNHASADEVGAALNLVVDKLAGNYTAQKTNVTETNAPGTDNRLYDLQVDGATKLKIASSGAATIVHGGTAAAPAVEIDRGSGGKLGLHAPADSQLALAANNESIIVDNDGSTPSLHGDVSSTWDIGEASFLFRRAYIATLVAPAIADAADVSKTVAIDASGITTATQRTITMPDADVDLGLIGTLATDAVRKVRCVDNSAADPATDYEDGDTVDGLTLATGDVVLKGYGTNSGPWVVQASGAAVRPSWYPNGGAANYRRVLVLEGTGAGNIFRTGEGTIDTTSLTWRNDTPHTRIIDFDGSGHPNTQIGTDWDADGLGTIAIDNQSGRGAWVATSVDTSSSIAWRRIAPHLIDLGTGTFSIDDEDDGIVGQWTGTGTGVNATVNGVAKGCVTTIILTGVGGSLDLIDGMTGSDLLVERGKTLTTEAPASGEGVIISLIGLASGDVLAVGDLVPV